MPRIKTKTSSFGTSKREGHDATQFYSSKLYNEFEINDKQEIIDLSDQLQPSMFINTINFSLEAIKEIPDHTIHLIIFDCSVNLAPQLSGNQIEKQIKSLFPELYRILITGGKICIIINNQDSSNSNTNFFPFHAIFALELVKLGFLMRGEVIWKNDNADINEKSGSPNKISNLIGSYKHILIYSKQVMKRGKKMNVDTISRDQFLQYTKSIWKHQPELMSDTNGNIPNDEALFDCYNHIMQLYSFESDKILCLIPNTFSKILPIVRQIRKNIIGILYERIESKTGL